jgi:SAM-dependent methyltransferase
MSWEESVVSLRSQPRFSRLIEDAYLADDLKGNAERFLNSVEWESTLQIVKNAFGDKKVSVLDIGAGNGIASIAFALQGYNVTSLEPDTSSIVGSGAIRKLAKLFKLDNINVVEGFGETLPFTDASFDIVYCRQVLHHAYNLNGFLKETHRVTKNGGILITLRDHVIKDEKDKQAFLKRHPLHKMYGGENAFTLAEYKRAILNAGFAINKIYDAASSPLNYSPWTKEKFFKEIQQKLPFLPGIPFVKNLAWAINLRRLKNIPGTLYSFIAKKN